MAEPVLIELDLPEDLEGFRLPPAVDQRLQSLLDKQDRGEGLSEAERQEAEGLVSIAEWLSLFRLRAERVARQRGLLK
jgi:hypothetical protein